MVMTKEEFEQLLTLEKRELIERIYNLRVRIEELEKHNTEMHWRLSPDLMGGQAIGKGRDRYGWR